MISKKSLARIGGGVVLAAFSAPSHAQKIDFAQFDNCKVISARFWREWNPLPLFTEKNCECAISLEKFPPDPDAVQADLRPILALVRCARPDFLELTVRAGQFDSLEKSLRQNGYSQQEIVKVRSCHAARIYDALIKSVASNSDFIYGVVDFDFCEKQR